MGLLNKGKTKYGILFPIYFVIMMLFYLEYLFLENYRMNQSIHWFSKSNLTQADVERINQFVTWTSNFELVFLALFTIAMCISFIGYRKNRESIKRFLAINITLFITITILSFVLLQVTQLPIGNLIQPIVIPTYLIGGLLVYMLLWGSRKHRLVEKN